MGDVIAVGIVVVFFALMLGLVRFCDHIIGPDDEALDRPVEVGSGSDEVEVGA